MYYSPDENVAFSVKIMIDHKRNICPSNFLKSEDVYCKHPWTHFNIPKDPRTLHNGRYLFVNRSEESGKTDGCESGCWRVMGRDRLIKSNAGKVLGFKKIYKFCEKKQVSPIREKKVWVMEEFRLAGKWEQDYVICKIRLLNPNPLEYLLCKQIRGYYV